MADYQPFADLALREQYRQKLNGIEGIALDAVVTSKRPSISLDALASADARSLDALLAAVDWALQQR